MVYSYGPLTSIPPRTSAAPICPWYLNSIYFNMVSAVEILHSLPLASWCRDNYSEINMVVISVSAAVPAPQQYMFGAR